MDDDYLNLLDELLINKNRQLDFPSKIQKFKAPLVATNDFPSRVSLNTEYGPFSGEEGENECQEAVSDSSLKQDQEKPQIMYWKRAEYSDKEAVTELISKFNFPLDELFREPDVPNLIEKSSFALIQFNSNHEIISFTSIFSYPDIPAVPSFEWYPWMEASYRIQNATPRNCYFIHYMAWDGRYYQDFLKLTLETIFLENSFASHIIITKPPKVKLPSIIPENFIQVLPRDAERYNCDSNSLQTILLCFRHSLLERLKIRFALVEDHDDLMPIIDQHTERMRELYGDYCMAEIIEYPGTEDRKTLVCEIGFLHRVDLDILANVSSTFAAVDVRAEKEVKTKREAAKNNQNKNEKSMGYAVGLMNINRFVDLDLLNSQFDLGVFHGLRKATDRDKITGDDAIVIEEEPVYLPQKLSPVLQIIDSEAMLKFLNWQPSLCVTKEELPPTETVEEQRKGVTSITQIIQETLNLKLAPKFSAHALSSAGSESHIKSDSSRSEGIMDVTGSENVPTVSQQSLQSLQFYDLPVYHGKQNAFLIEFYAMHNQFDDRLCQDFLEAAFEVFPDLEYCLITLPTQAPTFPLLDFFTRVTPRPLKRFRQELFVCHKSCVMLTFMRVRRITKPDLREIRRLLRGIKNEENIFADIASSCYYEDSAYQGFLLVCSTSIVGVAVICNEDGMEYLAHHYHVADLIDFDLHKMEYHAILKHLILSPIYQPHARFFLRDIMRMADVTSLYRARYEEAETNWQKASVITALGQLIPVKPRRMVRYHRPSLEPNVPPNFFIHRDLPFSLYHINSRVCNLKKFISNVNIVIVGTSRTAYSFLENLLFAPSSAYVTYNNIIWVGPHGMGTELPSHQARDIIFPYEGKYNRFYNIQICLKTYVHFVYGIMTHINRENRCITINHDSTIPYDYLILLCGRQYVPPVPIVLLEDEKVQLRNCRLKGTLNKYLTKQNDKAPVKGTYPPNMFLINTEVDATNAFISLQYLISRKKAFEPDEKIIMYGHNISTYFCIQALIEYGIKPTTLVLVEPVLAESCKISCFKDPNIDDAVLKNLSRLGIQHYKGYMLYDWKLCDNNQIVTVVFHSMHRVITIKCIAMIPFDQKLVSDVTFKAVNDASLVYDGKLVINSNFQTNDPRIYAAGGLTKYKRKYYAKNKNHHNFNSSEVGRHLADIVRRRLDPTEDTTEREPSELVPNMTEPIIIYGMLPGGWNYLSITKPGKFVDPETKAGLKEFGDELTTGDCDMTNGHGYFKLMIDDYGFVSGLLCYTKDSVDVENLETLYGKHEKLLNNLLYRFDLGLIEDFFSYFREPWAYAIFHDRFKFVMQKNTELFRDEKCSEDKEKVLDIIVNTLKATNWQRPTKEKLREIKEKFDESELKEKISRNILNFLCYFEEPFPMYATPGVLRVLLHDVNKSLLHKTVPNSSKTGITIGQLLRRA